MKSVVFLVLFFLLPFSSFAGERIQCEILLDINGERQLGSYQIDELSYNNFHAKYKSPFSSEIKETTNVRWIHYDQEMVDEYFVGNFRRVLSKVGGFRSEEIVSIDQYGIEMNGNASKAQVLLFYNNHNQLVTKVALQGQYVVKCL